ncbi:MAG: NTP transferase domain-containing protein [Deltaproteobacteria bacterium]|nr:NTP transferase domain-containing protein [Deltaproteobacteria bacterium]
MLPLPSSTAARHPVEATALVLAGGDSRRMGRDKALLRLGGRTLLERVVERIRPHVREVLVSARDPSRYAFLGLPGIADSVADAGPLVGIRDGLRVAAWPRLLVLACDVPTPDVPFLLSLLDDLDDADAAVPQAPPHVLQPTTAAYARSFLPHADRVLDAGGRSVLDALATARVRVRPLPASGALWNLNTPEDVAAFVAGGLAGDDVRLPLPEAAALVRARLQPLPPEPVGLSDAAGRVPVTDLCADLDVPPHDCAGRDGWAVRSADLVCATRDRPVVLPVAGTIAAGEVPASLAPGTAVRILTGALLPPGADAVVAGEEAVGSGASGPVAFGAPVAPGQHVETRGGEIRAGTVAWPGGCPIPAAAIGLLAACGHARIEVRRRPTVRILAVGDELVAAGDVPGPGRIRSSNALLLTALARADGARAEAPPPVPDRDEALADAIQGALAGCDLLVTVGGTGAGDRDRVGPVLARLGRTWFRGVALHPGGGAAFFEVDGTPCLALPGGPGGALAAWVALGRPALDRLLGLPAVAPLRVRLASAVEARRADRDTLRPARLIRGPEGDLAADPLPRGAPMATAAWAHVLIHLAAGVARLAAGVPADCLPLVRPPP